MKKLLFLGLSCLRCSKYPKAHACSHRNSCLSHSSQGVWTVSFSFDHGGSLMKPVEETNDFSSGCEDTDAAVNKSHYCLCHV